MKFNASKLFLTPQDVEQAIEYWLKKEVFSSISEANRNIANVRHTRNGATILLGVIK